MKKMIFSALAIALCSAFVACDKIDNGCKCTAKYSNGDSNTSTVKASEIKAAFSDVKTCAEYAKKAKAEYDKYASEYGSEEKLTSLKCKAAK